MSHDGLPILTSYPEKFREEGASNVRTSAGEGGTFEGVVSNAFTRFGYCLVKFFIRNTPYLFSLSLLLLFSSLFFLLRGLSADYAARVKEDIRSSVGSQNDPELTGCHPIILSIPLLVWSDSLHGLTSNEACDPLSTTVFMLSIIRAMRHRNT